ncbi:MAG: hypothetical protein ABIY51_02780 [Ferruginibacter sp.]
MKHTLIFYCFMHIFSCSHPAENKTTTAGTAKSIVHSKTGSSFNDTVIISFPAAIFYNPDSVQLIKIKSITDSIIFSGAMHEFFYQQRNARQVVSSQYPELKIIELSKTRFIQFNSKGKQLLIIDLDKEPDACGMLIFDGKKKPLLVDMSNVDTQLYFYFHK